MLVGAMETEVGDFKAAMAVQSTASRGKMKVYLGTLDRKTVLLVKSGVGKHCALQACRFIIDRYPVTGIVSFGLAGALRPRIELGDVLVCSDVRYAEGGETIRSDSRLAAIAAGCGLCTLPGTGVTCDRLVASPRAKRALRDMTSADVVDMESYWVGAVARENHIPFLTVRAISDAVDHSVPELPSYDWRRVVPYFLHHPVQGITLYRGVKRATRNLAVLTRHLVEVAG